MFQILRMTKDQDETGPAEYEVVGEFEEKPAPAVTLSGYLQALTAETGAAHIAVPTPGA